MVSAAIELPHSATAMASPRAFSKVAAIAMAHTVGFTPTDPNESSTHSPNQTATLSEVSDSAEKANSRITAPGRAIRRGPQRSSIRPTIGAKAAPHSVAMVSPSMISVRLQPNSASSGATSAPST